VDQGPAYINRIQVNRIGVSADADISAVKVYKDSVQDGGAFNAVDDVLLGSAGLSSALATVDITTVTLNTGATTVLFIVYDIAPGANPGLF